jgi:hypothetical protein
MYRYLFRISLATMLGFLPVAAAIAREGAMRVS